MEDGNILEVVMDWLDEHPVIERFLMGTLAGVLVCAAIAAALLPLVLVAITKQLKWMLLYIPIFVIGAGVFAALDLI